MRLCCVSRVHVAGSAAAYACFPVDACSVDCLSLKIMDSTLVSSRACPGLLSVMLHIEDTVLVSQSLDSQKCFCKLQRQQSFLSIFLKMKCNRNILFGNGKELKYIQEKMR